MKYTTIESEDMCSINPVKWQIEKMKKADKPYKISIYR